MPTVTTSPSTRAHSCSLLYFSSAGVSIFWILSGTAEQNFGLVEHADLILISQEGAGLVQGQPFHEIVLVVVQRRVAPGGPHQVEVDELVKASIDGGAHEPVLDGGDLGLDLDLHAGLFANLAQGRFFDGF